MGREGKVNMQTKRYWVTWWGYCTHGAHLLSVRFDQQKQTFSQETTLVITRNRGFKLFGKPWCCNFFLTKAFAGLIVFSHTARSLIVWVFILNRFIVLVTFDCQILHQAHVINRLRLFVTFHIVRPFCLESFCWWALLPGLLEMIASTCEHFCSF